MKKLVFLTLFSFPCFWVSCQTKQQEATQVNEPFQMIDYVEVGKKMDSIPPPYIINLKQGSKHLIFVGCNHVNDSTDQQFVAIEQQFMALKPQITFNEGGQVTKTYASIGKAIVANGETGCLKYLSDRTGIRMINGDLTDSLEFVLMLKKQSRNDLLLYYVMERLLIPYLHGAYGKEPFEQIYEKSIPKWFVAKGFPLTKTEQSFAFFKQLYHQKIGKPFTVALTDDIEKFDYINGGGCYYCAVGRQSKMVRDSVLLTKINHALNQYDRVMVTFGHGHALAIEPALKQLINRQR